MTTATYETTVLPVEKKNQCKKRKKKSVQMQEYLCMLQKYRSNIKIRYWCMGWQFIKLLDKVRLP